MVLSKLANDRQFADWELTVLKGRFRARQPGGDRKHGQIARGAICPNKYRGGLAMLKEMQEFSDGESTRQAKASVNWASSLCGLG